MCKLQHGYINILSVTNTMNYAITKTLNSVYHSLWWFMYACLIQVFLTGHPITVCWNRAGFCIKGAGQWQRTFILRGNDGSPFRVKEEHTVLRALQSVQFSLATQNCATIVCQLGAQLVRHWSSLLLSYSSDPLTVSPVTKYSLFNRKVPGSSGMVPLALFHWPVLHSLF